jgi:hypothetical protein
MAGLVRGGERHSRVGAELTVVAIVDVFPRFGRSGAGVCDRGPGQQIVSIANRHISVVHDLAVGRNRRSLRQSGDIDDDPPNGAALRICVDKSAMSSGDTRAADQEAGMCGIGVVAKHSSPRSASYLPALPSELRAGTEDLFRSACKLALGHPLRDLIEGLRRGFAVYEREFVVVGSFGINRVDCIRTGGGPLLANLGGRARVKTE